MNRRFMRYVKFFAVVLVLLSLVLTGCGEGENEKISDTKDDVAVMGSVDESGDKIDASDNKKRVAITYDDGPHNVRTKKIVDELEKYGYSATFFVVGNRVDGSEYNGSAGLRYAYEKGNEIAIHGYTHKYYYDTCTEAEYKDELSKTKKAINDVIDAPIFLMRPVGGRITGERVNTSSYSIIKWDVDSEDWKYKYSDRSADENADEKIETIVNNVMSTVQDGSIILMHDIYESTYDATVIILERLYAEGYEVVTVSELLGPLRSAGKLYNSGR